MKYIIAVKFQNSREVELYEFENEQDRLIYAESLRHRNDVQDISYTPIEREEDEQNR